MITRFDHAVVAVPDLEEAMERYRALGFEVRPGGHHESLGTHNAVVRFGLDYLELLTVREPEVTRKRGPFGETLLGFLSTGGGGLVGYCLSAEGLEEDAARLRGGGIDVEGPFPMERERPDGGVFAWRLVLLGGTPWRRPWPFLIEWGTPDHQRLSWERPGTHPNGVTGFVGVTLVVSNLGETTRLYAEQLRLPSAGALDPASSRASFTTGDCTITLVEPDSPGDPVARELATVGEGLYEVTLRCSDFSRAERVMAGNGIQTTQSGPGMLSIPHETACGARLVLRS